MCTFVYLSLCFSSFYFLLSLFYFILLKNLSICFLREREEESKELVGWGDGGGSGRRYGGGGETIIRIYCMKKILFLIKSCYIRYFVME